MPISPALRAAVSGMVGHKLRLDVLANNVANVDTPGFKAGRLSFEDALTQPYRFGGLDADLHIGGGIRPASLQPSFVQGTPQATDSPTDLAIYGDGFFRVRLPDGAEGYTRNGSFRPDATGRLVTVDGLPLAPDVVVPPDVAGDIRVDAGGRVLLAREGQAQEDVLGQIELVRFANPEGLEAIGQTLFRATPASGAATAGRPGQPGFGQIVGQALELSNVDIADEMSSLVLAQRAYGLSLKALQTTDEMLSLANNLRSR
jgi:flagellar basal-body rod protein FlgG